MKNALPMEEYGRLWSHRLTAVEIDSTDITVRYDTKEYIDTKDYSRYKHKPMSSYNAIEFKTNHLNAFVNRDRFIKVVSNG